jgi:hypothetical protein
MVDAVRGDGRTGREGFVSTLKDLIKDRESGIGAPLDLNGELGPPRLRLILCVLRPLVNCMSQRLVLSSSMSIPRPTAVLPLGLPNEMPDLRGGYKRCFCFGNSYMYVGVGGPMVCRVEANGLYLGVSSNGY